MKTIVALFFFILTNTCFCQQCTCSKVYEEVVEKIEENYSGFYDIMDSKFEEYNKVKNKQHVATYNIAIFNFNCYLEIKKYFAFFGDPHLVFLFDGKGKPNETRNFFSASFPIPAAADSAVKNYHNFLEGFWVDDNGRYSIKIIGLSKNHFIGTIVTGDSLYWFSNQVKIDISKKGNNWVATFYLKDHSTVIEKLEVEPNFFKIGRYVRFSRIGFESMMEKPQFKFSTVNDKCCYLKIPNFTVENARVIDSLIETNRSVIEKMPNLVIDLRNNGGGSIIGFAKILPLFGKQQFKKYGASFRSSKGTISKIEAYIKDTTLPQSIINGYKKLLIKLNNAKDTMVEISKTGDYFIDTFYRYPQKIFIFVNEKSASAAEQLLSYAQQSQKVTILGNTTAGATYYNDVNTIALDNCSFLIVNVPMSRTIKLY
jgi:hypothetical protein